MLGKLLFGHLNDTALIANYIPGHDTTACTLVWAVHCLSTNPSHQDRLRAEFRSLNKDVDALSYNDLESLKFLNNFLREVLRLYCPGKLEPPKSSITHSLFFFSSFLYTVPKDGN